MCRVVHTARGIVRRKEGREGGREGGRDQPEACKTKNAPQQEGRAGAPHPSPLVPAARQQEEESARAAFLSSVKEEEEA